MNEIYSAIYSRLSTQLAVPVHDHVPQDNQTYPYVRVDHLETDNNDVDDKSGFSATIQIVGFSRYRGGKEISDLASEIYTALHRHDFPDTISYGISGIEESFRRIATQPDGLTRNSVQQYKLFFEPL